MIILYTHTVLSDGDPIKRVEGGHGLISELEKEKQIYDREFANNFFVHTVPSSFFTAFLIAVATAFFATFFTSLSPLDNLGTHHIYLRIGVGVGVSCP